MCVGVGVDVRVFASMFDAGHKFVGQHTRTVFAIYQLFISAGIVRRIRIQMNVLRSLHTMFYIYRLYIKTTLSAHVNQAYAPVMLHKLRAGGEKLYQLLYTMLIRYLNTRRYYIPSTNRELRACSLRVRFVGDAYTPR